MLKKKILIYRVLPAYVNDSIFESYSYVVTVSEGHAKRGVHLGHLPQVLQQGGAILGIFNVPFNLLMTRPVQLRFIKRLLFVTGFSKA
jgi:hypothetical protein